MRFQSSYQPRLQSSENLTDPGRSTSKAHLCGYCLKASIPHHMASLQSFPEQGSWVNPEQRIQWRERRRARERQRENQDRTCSIIYNLVSKLLSYILALVQCERDLHKRVG